MRYDLMAVIGALVGMWAICLGCGLALERLLRLRLDNALVIPLGLCVASCSDPARIRSGRRRRSWPSR